MSTRDIVVAMDENEASLKSLRWALTNLYRSGDVFHLLHVLRLRQPSSAKASTVAPPVDSYPANQSETSKSFEEEAERMLRKFVLEELDAWAEVIQIHVEKAGVDSGEVSDAICQYAEDLNATMVVISSNNQSRFRQYLMGSTSTSVSKNCTLPVLVVH